jgi:hypothetical protein
MSAVADAVRQRCLLAREDGGGRAKGVVETLGGVNKGGMGTARVSKGSVQMTAGAR